MPPTHTDEGLQAAKAIRATAPRRRACSSSPSTSSSATPPSCSGHGTERVGYLLKDRVSDVAEFAASVRRVAAGGSALDPAVVSLLVGNRTDDPLDELTPREREVLELMAEGRSNQGIASRLVVTEHAVEKHVRNIFQKLGIHTDAEDHRRVLAVLAFLQSGPGRPDDLTRQRRPFRRPHARLGSNPAMRRASRCSTCTAPRAAPRSHRVRRQASRGEWASA